jgi:hypothetical protein
MCLAGANACPPEDVGVIGGYMAAGHARPRARRRSQRRESPDTPVEVIKPT